MAVSNVNNVLLMDGSPWASSTNRVEFHSVGLEETWSKDLGKPFHRPRSKANWAQDRETKLLDLKKVLHTFTLQGYIIGSPNKPEVGSTADNINYMLGSLVHDGGVQNMTWESNDGSVNWNTVNFNKVMSRKASKEEGVYWCQLNLIEGVDR